MMYLYICGGFFFLNWLTGSWIPKICSASFWWYLTTFCQCFFPLYYLNVTEVHRIAVSLNGDTFFHEDGGRGLFLFLVCGSNSHELSVPVLLEINSSQAIILHFWENAMAVQHRHVSAHFCLAGISQVDGKFRGLLETLLELVAQRHLLTEEELQNILRAEKTLLTSLSINDSWLVRNRRDVRGYGSMCTVGGLYDSKCKYLNILVILVTSSILFIVHYSTHSQRRFCNSLCYTNIDHIVI